MIVAGRLGLGAAAIAAVACHPPAVDSGRVHVEAAIAASRDARPGLDAWMESFHREPRLEEVAERLGEALAEDLARWPRGAAGPIAFFSELFRRHPERTRAWVDAVGVLDERTAPLLGRMLRDADTRDAADALVDLARAGGTVASAIEATRASRPRRPLDDEVTSGADLDVLWASFFASGDGRFVERLIGVAVEDAATLEGRVLAASTEWALTQNAGTHPRILEACERALARASATAQPKIERIVERARARRTPVSSFLR